MVTKGKIQESIVQENQQNSQIQAQSTEYFWYLTLSKEKEKCLKNLKFFSLRAATWNISTSRFEASVSRKTIFFLRLKWLSNLKREGNVILACLEVFFRQNISSWHTDSNAAQLAILCQEYMRKKREEQSLTAAAHRDSHHPKPCIYCFLSSSFHESPFCNNWREVWVNPTFLCPI